MINLATVSSAGDVFTVFLRESGTEVGGVGYAPNLDMSIFMQATYQAVPLGRPFFVMWRAEVPFDYETDPAFLGLDWDNPDGYGGTPPTE